MITVRPVCGQRGGSPWKKALYSVPLSMLFCLLKRSLDNRLHGCLMQLPAIRVINQGQRETEKSNLCCLPFAQGRHWTEGLSTGGRVGCIWICDSVVRGWAAFLCLYILSYVESILPPKNPTYMYSLCHAYTYLLHRTLVYWIWSAGCFSQHVWLSTVMEATSCSHCISSQHGCGRKEESHILMTCVWETSATLSGENWALRC